MEEERRVGNDLHRGRVDANVRVFKIANIFLQEENHLIPATGALGVRVKTCLSEISTEL